MSGGHADHLADLTALRFLVLDEADRMIEAGHFAELNLIVDAIMRARAADAPDAVADAADAEAPVAGKKANPPKAKAAAMAGAKKDHAALPLLPRHSPWQTFVFSATLAIDQFMPAKVREWAARRWRAFYFMYAHL